MLVSPYVSAASARANREFSEDEIRVIRDRYHGFEKATCKTLAAVFSTTPQKIARIVNSGREIL